MIYDTCDVLPLAVFIKVVKTGDVKLLNSNGTKAKIKKLEEAWQKILNEYTERINDSGSAKTLLIMKELSSLEHKVSLIYALIETLKCGYNQEVVDELNDLGIKYRRNLKEDYGKGLIKAINKTKPLLKRIGELKKQLPKDSKKDNFTDVLVELSKYQGYRVDPETTMASEYISILNSFKAHQSELKKQYGKRAKNR